jgi:Rrf2 family protein
MQERGNQAQFRVSGGLANLKISQKGLYALQAMMTLARRYEQGAIKIREIAADSDLPEKFLELILLELKNARMVESVRGARGGYRLRRHPSEIPLSDIIRLIDGPLAPLGDAEHLRGLIAKDAYHRALYQVFLEVRDAAAKILENTTIGDIVGARAGAEKVKKGSGAKIGAAPKKNSTL